MLLRAGVLVAAAAGFCVAFSLSASADVVEPKSAYQPAAGGLLQEEAAKKAVADSSAAAEEKAAADAKAAKLAKKEADEVVEPTPAPEQVVRQAPSRLTESTVTRSGPTLADRVTHPLRVGFYKIGASLGRVVGACEVGFGSGAGGPALVFAVLGMAAPFIRRRVFATRWTADEDVPEFLFARELTPPG